MLKVNADFVLMVIFAVRSRLDDVAIIQLRKEHVTDVCTQILIMY